MKAATVADQLLTMPQVAARLGCSRATAYRLIADGSIERVDIGRGRATKTRVSESALARYIARRAQ